MIIGQGNSFIQPNSATPPPVFPPFPPLSADNGLSVDAITGRIVFADFDYDPLAPGGLKNNRALFLQDFYWIVYDNVTNGFTQMYLDPFNGFQQIGDISAAVGGQALSMEQIANRTLLGDLNNTFGGYLMTMDNVSPVMILAQAANRFLLQTSAAGQMVVQLGDIDNFATRVFLRLDSQGEHIRLVHQNTACLDYDFNAGFLDQGDVAGKNFLRFDIANRVAIMGDVPGFLNGTIFQVDDNNNRFLFANAANNAVINMNGVAGFTGTVLLPTTITVNGGIVTNVA